MKYFKRYASVLLAVLIAVTFLAAPVAAREEAPASEEAIWAEVRDHSREAAEAQQARKRAAKDAWKTFEQSPLMNESIRIMVEMEASPARSTGRSEADVLADQTTIQDQVLAMATSDVLNRFGYLSNGFTVEVKRKDLPRILNIRGVKTVTEVPIFYPTMFNATHMTHAVQVWDALKYRGEGMLVSIVDSGVDPNHKDMRISDLATAKLSEGDVERIRRTEGLPGHYFTPKVPYGYNYADKNQNIVDECLSGRDAELDASMHGMHVAGIAAANATDEDYAAKKGIRGMAPEAQILAMKVFSNHQTGGAWGDDILRAIEDSVKLGADIINLSLGSSSGFTQSDNALTRAITAATDAGTLLVFAAGNDGLAYDANGATFNQVGTEADAYDVLNPLDSGVVSSNSTHPDVLSVASVDNTSAMSPLMHYATDAEGSDPVAFALDEQKEPEGGRTFKDGAWIEVIDVGLGTEEELEALDVDGKYALALRGDISFRQKSAYAANAGALGIFIRDNAPTFMHLNMTDVEYGGISSVFLWQGIGEQLADRLASGERVFINTEVSEDFIAMSDIVHPSIFTSWGPTPELGFKPDVAGVGGSVYSTLNDHEYGVMSGTSMAAPHVAGATALLLQAMENRPALADLKGRERVEYLKVVLSNTATPLMDAEHPNAVHSPRRVGAGMIDLRKAIDATVTLTHKGQGHVALSSFEGATTFALTFKNYGDIDITYRAPKTPAVYTGHHIGEVYDRVVEDATVTFSDADLIVPAGGEVTVECTLHPGTLQDNYIEGYLTFTTDDDAPDLTMPYMGFVGDWNAMPIFDYVEGMGPEAFAKGGYLDTIVPSAQGIPRMFRLLTATTLYTDKYIPFQGIYVPPSNWWDWMFNYPYGTTLDPHAIGLNNDPAITEPVSEDYRETIIRELIPRIGTFRGVRNAECFITNENGEELRVVDRIDEIRKPAFVKLANANAEAHLAYDAAWDGTIYNPATGDFDPVPEGHYHYNIRARMDESDPWQVVSIPLKVDNTPPIVTMPEVSEIEFDPDWDWMIIDIDDIDDGDGVGFNAFDFSMEFEFTNLDGESSPRIELEGANVMYEDWYDIGWIAGFSNPLLKYGVKSGTVYLHFRDYVGNTRTVKSELRYAEDEEVFVPGKLVAPEASWQNKYEILNGHYGEYTLTYNREDIETLGLEPGKECVVPIFADSRDIVSSTVTQGDTTTSKQPFVDGWSEHVIEGLNESEMYELTLKGYNADGEAVADKTIGFAYDTVAPWLTMDEEVKVNRHGFPYIDFTNKIHVTPHDNGDPEDFTVRVFGYDGTRNWRGEKKIYQKNKAKIGETLEVPVGGDGFDFVLLMAEDLCGNVGEELDELLFFWVLPEGMDPDDLNPASAAPSDTLPLGQLAVTTPGFEGIFDFAAAAIRLEDGAESMDLTLEGLHDHVSAFLIDGEPVELNDDGTWTHTFHLVEGVNEFNLYATDDSEDAPRPFYDAKLRIYCDGTVPTIVLNTDPRSVPGEFVFPDGVEDPDEGNMPPQVIWTPEEAVDVTLSGVVSDNTFGYKLVINGDVVLDFANLDGLGPEVNERTFERTLEQVQADEFIRIELFDTPDFDTPDHVLQKIQVRRDNVAPTLLPQYTRTASEGAKPEALEEDVVLNAEDGIVLSVIAEDDLSGVDGTAEIWVNGQLYDGEPLEPGIYGVVFRAKDMAGNETIEVRNIIVYGPPILDVGADLEIYPEDVEVFDPMTGVTAEDSVTGADLTEDVTYACDEPAAFDAELSGTYTFTYQVTHHHRTVTETRLVTILGRPMILGVQDREVTVGTPFDPLDGIQAVDADDGDLTDRILVEGCVHTDVPGTYPLTYTVYDRHGNKAVATCEVTVVEKTVVPDQPDQPDQPVTPVQPTEPKDPGFVEPTGEFVWTNYVALILMMDAILILAVIACIVRKGLHQRN